MSSAVKVLIASGSRHTIPAQKNSPGVPRIIQKLTEKDFNKIEFKVASKYDDALRNQVYDKKKYLHPTETIWTRIFSVILNKLPYSFKKKIYGYTQTDRIVYYNGLRTIVKKEQPDIVITFMHVELFKLLQKAYPNAKHVYFFRSTDLKGRIGQNNIKYLINHSAGFLANTQSPITELTSYNKSNKKLLLDTIYNAVSVNNLTVDQQKGIRNAFREKHGVLESDFIIGYAGRFSEEKSLLELYEVINRLKSEGIIVKLIIAGDINNEKTPDIAYYNTLKKYEKEHIPNQVIYAGWITNTELYHFYSAIDLGVLLSKYREGNSMFLIETLSYGKPIIATKIGGNVEIVKDGETGFLIDNTEADYKEKIYDLIVVLLRNPSLYNSLSTAAQDYISKNHTEEIMVDKFQSYIAKIANV